MLVDRRSFDTGNAVNGEDRATRVVGDSTSLVGTIDDAGDDAVPVGDEHVAGFERLFLTVVKRVAFRALGDVHEEGRSERREVVPGGEELVLELGQKHR